MKQKLIFFIIYFLFLISIGMIFLSVREASAEEGDTQSSQISTSIENTVDSSDSTQRTSDTESSSEETFESTESSKYEDIQPFILERALGNGTQENPFLVSTAQELKQAFNTSFTQGQTVHYIKLVNDIIYNDSDTRFTISKNTVLDGDGHALLYNGTNLWCGSVRNRSEQSYYYV